MVRFNGSDAGVLMFAIFGVAVAAAIGATIALVRIRRRTPAGSSAALTPVRLDSPADRSQRLLLGEPVLAANLVAADDDTVPRRVLAEMAGQVPRGAAPARPVASAGSKAEPDAQSAALAGSELGPGASFRTLPSTGALAKLLQAVPARGGRRHGSYQFSALVDDPAFTLEARHARRPPWNARMTVPAGVLTVLGVERTDRWPEIDLDLAGIPAAAGERFLLIYYTFEQSESITVDNAPDADPLAGWAQLSVLVDGVRQPVQDPSHGQSILVMAVPAAARSLTVVLESHGRLEMLNLLSGARRHA